MSQTPAQRAASDESIGTGIASDLMRISQKYHDSDMTHTQYAAACSKLWREAEHCGVVPVVTRQLLEQSRISS